MIADPLAAQALDMAERLSARLAQADRARQPVHLPQEWLRRNAMLLTALTAEREASRRREAELRATVTRLSRTAAAA